MTPEEKFRRGLELFNSGQFFLAHEIWEELWMEEPQPEKLFLQGLIQTAAAFHHYARGNCVGAESLLAAAAVKLQRFLPSHRGIRVERLRGDIIQWARMLGNGAHPGTDQLPQILQL